MAKSEMYFVWDGLSKLGGGILAGNLVAFFVSETTRPVYYFLGFIGFACLIGGEIGLYFKAKK